LDEQQQQLQQQQQERENARRGVAQTNSRLNC
jgi:chromosome segregation protein